MSELKKKLFDYCHSFVKERIELAERGIKNAQEAANTETKSSAGDKYETGRAMMHLEKQKLSGQLAETLKMKRALDQIDLSKEFVKGALGAIITTSNANYFLSVSAGKITTNEEVWFAISPASPIGQELMNKKAGDTFSFAGKEHSIQSIA